jgi:hypothetical protein
VSSGETAAGAERVATASACAEADDTGASPTGGAATPFSSVF